MTGLLIPLKIKNLEIKNRIVLPPMATEKATTEGIVTRELINHYVRYATAGVGLIIIEHAYISEEGKNSPNQLSVASDEVIDGLSSLAREIHNAGGRVGLQINHCGMAGRPEIVGQPVGPSALSHPRREKTERAKELSIAEIKILIEKFALAALRVKRAGFDMVEIHAAHGFLINQFNSPLTNRRQDKYGGDLERRFTLARDVIRAVREAVGEEYPIFFRLGADDLIEGGLTLADSMVAGPSLVKAGIDVFDLSGGFGGYRAGDEQGYFTYLARGMKKVVSIPLIVTGGITDAHKANEIIENGHAELVGIGRAMLKDYQWAKKAIEILS